jgi:beta-alanine--pyruvate transaminase
MAPVFEDAVHSLKGSPHVIDIRNIGMMAAIELEPRAEEPALRAMDAFRRCFDTGVLIRTTGDTIALTPPLIIDEQQIDQIVATIGQALRSID